MLWAAGCTTTQQVFLQDVTVKGPMFQPPVNIARGDSAGTFRIMPRLAVYSERSLSGSIDGHSPVGTNGKFNVDTVRNSDGTWTLSDAGGNSYPYTGNNFGWNMPSFEFAVDCQYFMSNKAAFTFGASYAATGDQSQFGASAGLGISSIGRDAAFRIDAGAHLQSMSYEATTLVKTTTTLFGSTSQEIGIFRDRDSETHLDFYGSLTINSKVEDWPADVFLSVAIARQKLTGFNPHTTVLEGPFVLYSFSDARADASATVFSLSPGVSVNLGDSQRIQVGVRYLSWTDIHNGSPSQFFSPFIQFDLRP